MYASADYQTYTDYADDGLTGFTVRHNNILHTALSIYRQYIIKLLNN